MSRRTGFIDLKYILSLLIDYIKGIHRLKPMSDYQLIEFVRLKNIHIFGKQSNNSLCGKITKSKHDVKERKGFFTLREIRQEVVDQANGGFDLCGSCIGTLYSDDDIKD